MRWPGGLLQFITSVKKIMRLRDIIMYSSIVIAISLGAFLFFNLNCNSVDRLDKYENITLENLCNASTAEYIFNKDRSLAREYICMCQQGGKQSDQNLCETIVNSNNTRVILDACGNDRDCIELFFKRK